MVEFVVGDGLFTLENGVLEYWVGGSSRGRYRVADIVRGSLEVREGKKGRISLRIEPSGSFSQLGISGIEVPVSNRAELQPLLDAIERIAN